MRRIIASVVTLLSVCAGCDSLVDNRLPALPVDIRLSDAGTWNTYGVAGFGIYRYFIRQQLLPAGFHYTQTTYTGFGGVLLIGGMDPFTGDTQVPLAYDMACPVECDPNVRVYIEPERYEAVCEKCGSHYDVTMAGGAPVSGIAASGKHKYGLQRYSCIPSPFGGYEIRR